MCAKRHIHGVCTFENSAALQEGSLPYFDHRPSTARQQRLCNACGVVNGGLLFMRACIRITHDVCDMYVFEYVCVQSMNENKRHVCVHAKRK